MHAALSAALRRVIHFAVSKSNRQNVTVMNGEPAVEQYMPSIEPAQSAGAQAVQRRADVGYSYYPEGSDEPRNVLIDVTFTCPTALSHQFIDYYPGSTANAYAVEKLQKYTSRFDVDGAKPRTSLVIFAVETNGAFGKEAIQCGKAIAKLAAGADGASDHITLSYIWQQLSVAVQVARAQQVLYATETFTTAAGMQVAQQTPRPRATAASRRGSRVG